MTDPTATLHHLAAARALVWLRYNRRSEEVLRMVFADYDALHPEYREAMAAAWLDEPLLFLSKLDGPNSVRFWREAMTMYAADAYRSAHHAFATANITLTDGD